MRIIAGRARQDGGISGQQVTLPVTIAGTTISVTVPLDGELDMKTLAVELPDGRLLRISDDGSCEVRLHDPGAFRKEHTVQFSLPGIADLQRCDYLAHSARYDADDAGYLARYDAAYEQWEQAHAQWEEDGQPGTEPEEPEREYPQGRYPEDPWPDGGYFTMPVRHRHL